MNQARNLIDIVLKRIVFYFFCLIVCSCHQKEDNKKNAPLPKPVITNKSQSSKKVADNGCSYDNEVSTLGLGLVIAPTKIEIFDDSLLTSKSATYDMDHDDGKKINICPKFFKPDYGIAHFVCIGTTTKAFKVLTGYAESKYLPKTRDYVFKSWPDYINESYGVRRLSSQGKNFSMPHQEPLRKAPSNDADTLAIPSGYEMFCPVETKGDWLKVKFDCFYNNENNPHEGERCKNFIDQCKDPVSGWLKWREGNKLLIDIFLLE